MREKNANACGKKKVARDASGAAASVSHSLFLGAACQPGDFARYRVAHMSGKEERLENDGLLVKHEEHKRMLGPLAIAAYAFFQASGGTVRLRRRSAG